MSGMHSWGVVNRWGHSFGWNKIVSRIWPLLWPNIGYRRYGNRLYVSVLCIKHPNFAKIHFSFYRVLLKVIKLSLLDVRMRLLKAYQLSLRQHKELFMKNLITQV